MNSINHSTRYDAYIFDVGGVLFDWNLEKTAANYFSVEELPQGLYFLHDIWWRLDIGSLSRTGLRDYLMDKNCPNAYLCKIESVVKHFVYDLEPIKVNLEALESIISLNQSVFILSNFQYEAYCILEEMYPVLKKVKDKTISSTVCMLKPDTKIFEYAKHKFQVNPETTLFIDDMSKNIDSAKQLGFKTHHFSVCNDFSALENIV